MNQLSLLAKVVVIGVAITSAISTPLFSYDPINAPRFLALVITASLAFPLFFSNSNRIMYKLGKNLVGAGILFIIASISTLVFSGSNLTEQFFGVTGRQTGFMFYMSLLVLLVSSALVASSENFLNQLTNALIVVGSLTLIYGFFQFFQLDPFDWINEYSPVFGIFGNPNFQSSFLGMTGTVVLARILNKTFKRYIYVPLLVLIIFEIYLTKSQQGFLVLLAGSSIVVFQFIRSTFRNKAILRTYILFVGLGFIGVIADILQKTPWASLLYKPSVSFRGDFWRAGWNMTRQNPIFGVGFDGYRDNYRITRDLVAAQRPEGANYVDSAHNVFLDISSNGGFPLLFAYLGLIILGGYSAIQISKRLTSFSPGFAAIFAVWVAYLAQSLISINQIGIAVWGWVTTGALIGFERATRNTNEKVDKKTQKTEDRSLSSIKPARIIIGLIVGLLIGLPVVVRDALFRSTVNSGEVNAIQANVLSWPRSVSQLNLVSNIFRKGGFPDRALVVSRNAVTFNPNNYEAWLEYYQLPNISEDERSNALSKLKNLDPYGKIPVVE